MRIIDADELVKQLKQYDKSAELLSLQMATKHLIAVVESQATVADERAKEERIAELEKCNAELKKKFEARELHVQQLQEAREHDSGVIEALQFAVRCNGISPDVTLPFH